MSQYATFLLPLAEPGVQQEELNRFLKSHAVLHVDHQLTSNGWAFCVEWTEGKVAADWREKRVDYREVLTPEAFERFRVLRGRRKAIAVEDGVEPFVIMTDAQLAEAATAEKLTAEVLKHIKGFGEKRFAKFGSRLLDEIKEENK